MKKISFLALLCFSTAAFSQTIHCRGLNTPTNVSLGLTQKMFPLNHAEYSFRDKVVSTSGFEFGIQSSKQAGEQKLTYKFVVLKSHKLAKKKEILSLTIGQSIDNAQPFEFHLQEEHMAEISKEGPGMKVVIDQMICQTI
jgi:hypothetical protein